MGLIEEEARDRRRSIRELHARRVGTVAVESIRGDLAAIQRVGGELDRQIPVAHADVVRVQVAASEIMATLRPASRIERVEVVGEVQRPRRSKPCEKPYL